jgi:hypothetical protein
MLGAVGTELSDRAARGRIGSKEEGRLVYSGNSKRKLKMEILVKDCFGGHYENKRYQ